MCVCERERERERERLSFFLSRFFFYFNFFCLFSCLGINELQASLEMLKHEWFSAWPPKDNAHERAWKILGAPPFVITWSLPSGDVLLHLRVEENMFYMNTVSFSQNDPFGAWGDRKSNV